MPFCRLFSFSWNCVTLGREPWCGVAGAWFDLVVVAVVAVSSLLSRVSGRI